MTTTRAAQPDTIAAGLTKGLHIAAQDRHRPANAEAGQLAHAQWLAVNGVAEYVAYSAGADWDTYFTAYPRPLVREDAVPMARAWLSEQLGSAEPVFVGYAQTTAGEAAADLLACIADL